MPFPITVHIYWYSKSPKPEELIEVLKQEIKEPKLLNESASKILKKTTIQGSSEREVNLIEFKVRGLAKALITSSSIKRIISIKFPQTNKKIGIQVYFNRKTVWSFLEEVDKILEDLISSSVVILPKRKFKILGGKII